MTRPHRKANIRHVAYQLDGQPLPAQMHRRVGDLDQRERRTVEAIHQHAAIGEGTGELHLGGMLPGAGECLASRTMTHREHVT